MAIFKGHQGHIKRTRWAIQNGQLKKRAMQPLGNGRLTYFAVIRRNGERYTAKICQCIVIYPYPVLNIAFSYSFCIEVITAGKSSDEHCYLFSFTKGMNTHGNSYIIYSTSGNVTIKNVSVCNGMAIAEEVNGSLTFEGVYTFGTVSGSDNNYCVRYVSYSHLNVNITFDRCDNYSNIIGTGYVAAYVGAYYWNYRVEGSSAYWSAESHFVFNECANYGSLQSTEKAASMLFLNLTNRKTTGDIYITITDCENKGNITFAGSESAYDSTLAVNLQVSENMPYTGRNNFYINGTEVIKNTAKIAQKKANINNAIATCLTGTQPERVGNIWQISVN